MRYDRGIMRATQAHIYLNNLQYNISQIKMFLKHDERLCIPVKADGYGHGAVRVAIAAIKSGASFLAVASVSEGIELREAGIVAPILSLSLPTPEEIPFLIVHSITPLVFDAEFIDELGKAATDMNRTIPVHLKIDTGMGRIGCRCEDAAFLAERIQEQKGLFLEGVCTHFSASDSVLPDDIAYTKLQLSRFTNALEDIRAKGIDTGIVHAANSGAVVLYPESHFDMVRPGILVYGYVPDASLSPYIQVKPVMELQTQVVMLKHIAKGEYISYGRQWCALNDTYIATIPIGYADGLPRRLSQKLKVLINGKTYPIAGRICMDQCMIDIGNANEVKRWDTVTVFGPDERTVSAAGIAEKLDTIPYEITCAIHKRVPRIYHV